MHILGRHDVPSAAASRAIVVLARAPSAPGKSRLTGGLSDDRARALREALLLDTLDVARTVGVPIVISYTPDDARDEMAGLAGDIALVPQRGANLGERMRWAMDDTFASGAESVVLIGSDLPTLPLEHLTDAFAMLESPADLVLGPAEDGGFYLVAARQPRPEVFHGIEWGTPHVLDRVADAARRAGLTVGLTRSWWDVDTPDDLRRAVEDLRPDAAQHVRAWACHFLNE
jgi:rSAM/selenodomain-associated transferase 1